MFFWRRRLRPLTRFALAAILALALLPAVSHAVAFVRGAGAWTEVCTLQGTRLLATDAGSGPAQGAPWPAAGHLEHCPLCALAGAALGPPQAPPQPLPPLRVVTVSQPVSPAPGGPVAWRGPQPRGPPVCA